MNNFLVLPVLFPIIMGALMGLFKFKNRRVRNVYILLTSIITSAFVFYVILNHGELTELTLFEFDKNIDITLSLDGSGIIFSALIAVLWPLAISYSAEYMIHEGGENTFYAYYLMTYGVTCGIAFSDNLITLYFFYEFLTLVTLPIVMHGMKKKSVEAGVQYVIYSIGGAAFAFMGMVFILHYAGTTEFVYGGLFKNGLVSVSPLIVQILFMMCFFGFGVKAAVFPFHSWLPTAGIAPTPVTALLHAVAVVNSGAFAVIRTIYFVFGVDLLYGTWAQNVCIIISAVTILFGSSMALKEQHFKRRLAYSTVSNLSYMLFGASLMTPAGLTGAFSHFVFHGIMKITLFFVAGIVLCKYEKHFVDEIYGYGRKMKITFACFTISGLALMGVPPLIGFASKWQLLTAAAGAGTVLSKVGIGVILVSALLTSMYILSVVIKAYFPGPEFDYDTIKDVKDPGLHMTIPLVILSIMVIAGGIYSSEIVDFIAFVANGNI